MDNKKFSEFKKNLKKEIIDTIRRENLKKNDFGWYFLDIKRGMYYMAFALKRTGIITDKQFDNLDKELRSMEYCALMDSRNVVMVNMARDEGEKDE